MKLSLSVRVAESFRDKRVATMELEELATLAAECGYDAVCLRASQVGIDSTKEEIRAAAKILDQHQLTASMVTGDFAIPENSAEGPAALRNITPYLDLAESLDCELLRISMRTPDDLEYARYAADEASERGIRLAHQCHTQSLFETIDETLEVLRSIGHQNFGLIYEPANLELCGQEVAGATIEALAPWIFNVYVQNQRLNPNGADQVTTWCRGGVRFDQIPLWEPNGLNFERIIADLAEVGYDSWVTVHQASAGLGGGVTATRRSAEFLRTTGPFDTRSSTDG
ncbi:MAG: sugar phosphate isomerase/epimerase [Gemmatimonadetes bacterium]|jgi:sugar phosphate isomerase/epimerase|nr:sugar phosphate isomerase/epimerase [Gemmatimonadota bacterium]MBT6144905.1 sugar phosphate isomerase/epimerase [Gemmatimonadota bacterium]MBT7859148.1 sugar phosphate isomerase/epimerase [Gemmatimonadota bacterium]